MSYIKRYLDEKANRIAKKFGLDWVDVMDVLMEVINDPTFCSQDNTISQETLEEGEKYKSVNINTNLQGFLDKQKDLCAGAEPKVSITTGYLQKDLWSGAEPKVPISTGYLPVEYNYYMELKSKACKYDRIMDYISQQEVQNAEH